MKKQLFALLGLGLLFTTASAYAQTVALKANVPFNFIVTGKTLPAGEYDIQSLSGNERVLVIRGAEASPKMVMASPCESVRPSDKTKLIFHRYGDRYFLSQIWTAGNSSGTELPQSRREAEVAMDFPMQQVVLIASR
jgi:hypothetical protein